MKVELTNLQFYLPKITVLLTVFAAISILVQRSKHLVMWKWFSTYIAMRALCEVIVAITSSFSIQTMPIIHVYNVLDFFTVSFFFKAFFKYYGWTFLNTRLIGLGALLLIGNSFFFESVFEYNPYSKSVVQVILLGFCFLGLYLLTVKEVKVQYHKAVRIVISALFLNYAGTLFLYLFSQQIAQLSNDVQRNIWLINAVVNMMVQGFFLMAAWQIMKSNKNKND